jgi:hypothetical protein
MMLWCVGCCTAHRACTDTLFTVSKQKGRSSDLGYIKKKRARNFAEWCAQLCTTTDVYEARMTDDFKALSVEARAALLGQAMHIDYLLFENDQPPCTIKSSRDGKSGVIICTLCEMFCYGVTCPIVRAAVPACRCAVLCRPCPRSLDCMCGTGRGCSKSASPTDQRTSDAAAFTD